MPTLVSVHDSARPGAVQQAAETGTVPNRGPSSTLGVAKYRKIRQLIAKGKKDAEIADKVGCGSSTVSRTRQKMKEEGKSDSAA